MRDQEIASLKNLEVRFLEGYEVMKGVGEMEIRKQRNRETSLLGGPSIKVNQEENACSKGMSCTVLWKVFIMLLVL